MRFFIALLIIACLIVCGCTTISTMPATTTVTGFDSEIAPIYVGMTTVKFYPIADAYVDENMPSMNFGSSASLHVTSDRSTYIMFDLSSIPSDAYVVNARLKLYCFEGTYCLMGSCYVDAYYCSDNSWMEMGITYNNRPSYSEVQTYGNSMGMFTGWESWGVTSDVRTVMELSDKKLTEVLVMDGATGIFRSREGTSSPFLEVEYLQSPYYEITLESIQDNQETSNMGFVTVEGPITFLPWTATLLPGKLIATPGSYGISYDGGYNFLRWETSGGVSVTNATARATNMTVSGSGTLRAVGDVETFEYYHDDGNAVSSSSDKAGRMYAVMFTPSYPGNLVGARFFIEDPHPFKVHVLDADRNDIIPPFTTTPPVTGMFDLDRGWYDVDLSEYDISLSSGVGFYIGMEWITDHDPNLGYSNTGGSSGMSWQWDGMSWDTHAEYQNYMIRAVVEHSVP